ncbi:MAG: flagellar hook-associated protein FlgL [Formivibrio sp.]|nr:flagellar hook-associated protein FlgL [Formivibrio sp.]
MRVATTTLYSISVNGLQQETANQARLQQQLSTGSKILTPSDDPIASARILDINQTSSITAQYAVNSQTADSALSTTEATMTQIVSVIQNMQTLAVHAGNGSLTPSDMQSINSELQGNYQQLLGLANSTDGSGIYMFSGYQGDTKPFTETSPGNVTYNGDDGVRKVQISSGRQIPISDNGNDVFRNIKNGNGTFATAANASNGGTGIVGVGNVLDPTKWSAAGSKDFSVQFYWQTNPSAPTAPTITYDLVDNSSGKSLIDGAPSAGRTSGPRSYVAGSDIDFKQLPGEAAVPPWDYGVNVNVSGSPVAIDATTKLPVGSPGAADSFSVKASSNVDVFATAGAFSNALSNYSTDSTGKGPAAFQNQLNGVMQGLNNALSQVLKVQASIGARMSETSSVQSTNSDLQLQYSQTISGLQSLDYASAISDFSMNQMLLEATRSSFAKVQDLSLFKYI